jgi:hypothetical protein
MRRRLYARTADDWAVEPGEIERVLELNRSGEKPAGAIDVDATQPLNQVGAGRGPGCSITGPIWRGSGARLPLPPGRARSLVTSGGASVAAVKRKQRCTPERPVT